MEKCLVRCPSCTVHRQCNVCILQSESFSFDALKKHGKKGEFNEWIIIKVCNNFMFHLFIQRTRHTKVNEISSVCSSARGDFLLPSSRDLAHKKRDSMEKLNNNSRKKLAMTKAKRNGISWTFECQFSRVLLRISCLLCSLGSAHINNIYFSWVVCCVCLWCSNNSSEHKSPARRFVLLNIQFS